MTIPNRENSIWRFSDMATKWEHGSWCLVRNCCLLGCSPSPRPYTHSQVGTGHWKNKFSNSIFISIVWLNVWNHKRDVCYINVSRTKKTYSWGFRFLTVLCLCVLFCALGKTWNEDSTLHSPSHSGSPWSTLSRGTVVRVRKGLTDCSEVPSLEPLQYSLPGFVVAGWQVEREATGSDFLSLKLLENLL